MKGQVRYAFESATRDGATVMYSAARTGHGGVLSLRPVDWRTRLCDLIGCREFTAEERKLLPVPVPLGPSCA